jgi:uncharacterized protein
MRHGSEDHGMKGEDKLADKPSGNAAHHSVKGAELKQAILLHVRNLSQGPHPVEVDRSADVLDLPVFGKQLRIRGTVTKENDRIDLDATASAEGHFECTRCTEEFDRVIKAHVVAHFVPAALATEDDDDSIHVYEPFQSPMIDITEDVRDALALAIPMKHLCKPNCKGICPHCGKDLNVDQCDCLPEEIGGNWSALKGLQERLRAEELKKPGR